MGEATKTSKLAHHTFSPWQVDGDRRVVAGEREWDAVKGLDIVAQHMHQTRRVLVGVDVSEDYCVRVNGGPLTDVVNPITLADVRLRLFSLIDATPNLDWLMFTRWPENVAGMMPGVGMLTSDLMVWPDMPTNLFLGVDIDDQAAADARIPHLLRVPAKVRFLSVEPLLGPVNLGPWLGPWTCDGEAGVGAHDGKHGPNSYCGSICRDYGKPRGPLDWVIVGGESGPNARPCRVEWIRDIVRQCQAAGVPVFVKQLGANVRYVGDRDVLPNGIEQRLSLLDPKGGDPSEWPADLRIREVPT